MAGNLSVLNGHFSDINPVTAGWDSCESGHSWGPACRDYYLLHFVVSGTGTFQRGQSIYTLKGGDVFFVRPGELVYYEASKDDPWSYIWVGFAGDKCEELLCSTPLGDSKCTGEMPYLRSTFERIKSFSNGGHISELALCAMIYEMLALMQKQASAHAKGDYVARTADFIRANYAMPITIESIAKMIGLDRRYLCRLFAIETGQTPKEFLVNTRLERAAMFLSSPDITVSEAACSVGYTDVFNFSKMFKKKYGVSPQQYKKLSAADKKNDKTEVI